MNPYLQKGHSCVAMFLTNLAKPDWIQVPCDKPIVGHIFCLIEDMDDQLKETHPTLVMNHKLCVLLNMTCYKFDVKKFQFLFETIPVTFPQIFTHDFKNT